MNPEHVHLRECAARNIDDLFRGECDCDATEMASTRDGSAVPEGEQAMIPVEQWEWFGHAGHFVAAASCRFRLHTRVGDYRISTVGDYVLPGSGCSASSSRTARCG